MPLEILSTQQPDPAVAHLPHLESRATRADLHRPLGLCNTLSLRLRLRLSSSGPTSTVGPPPFEHPILTRELESFRCGLGIVERVARTAITGSTKNRVGDGST